MKAKLYSPVFVVLWEEKDIYHDNPIDLDQQTAAKYVDELRTAIRKGRQADEPDRGLMCDYGLDDMVDYKVRSVFVDYEIHSDKLYVVATLDISEPLAVDEFDLIRDFLEAQYMYGIHGDISQKLIEVDGGELTVSLTKPDNDFYIDTQTEFARRTGVNLPADVLSRHAPKVNGFPALTDMQQKLGEHLKKNLTEYHEEMESLAAADIIERAGEIAAVGAIYKYMSDYPEMFDASDAEYLLRLDNPLQQIAAEWQERNTDTGSLSYTLEVFLRNPEDIPGLPDITQETLQPTVSDSVYLDTPENRTAIDDHFDRHHLSLPASPELTEAIHKRLGENFANYKANIELYSVSEVFGEAEEIAAVCQAHAYFRYEHAYTTGQAEFLLRFQDPLELLSNHWSGMPSAFISDMVDGIFSEQQWILQNGGYTLVSDEFVPTAQESSQTNTDTVERPSILGQIRRHQYEARKNPAPPKDVPNRNKHNPER